MVEDILFSFGVVFFSWDVIVVFIINVVFYFCYFVYLCVILGLLGVRFYLEKGCVGLSSLNIFGLVYV